MVITKYHWARITSHLLLFEANVHLYQFTQIPFGVTNRVTTFHGATDKHVNEENIVNTFLHLAKKKKKKKKKNHHCKERLSVKMFLEAAQCWQLTLNESKSTLSSNEIFACKSKISGYEIGNGLDWLVESGSQPLLDMWIPTKIAALKRVLGMFIYYAKWTPHFPDCAQPLNKAKHFQLDTGACETKKKTAAYEGCTTLPWKYKTACNRIQYFRCCHNSYSKLVWVTHCLHVLNPKITIKLITQLLRKRLLQGLKPWGNGLIFCLANIYPCAEMQSIYSTAWTDRAYNSIIYDGNCTS